MHLGYKEFLEEKDKFFIESPITPVFKDFLEYFKVFSHLRFSETLEIDELSEALGEKKDFLKNKRGDLQSIKGMKEGEIVLLMNLQPSTVDEAVNWIPSLQRKMFKGKAKDIHNAIETIDKYSSPEFKT